jgi:protein-L-isoaspartate O-methyltransferase
VISTIAAISYNNLVSNISNVDKVANEVKTLTDRQEARIRQLEAQNETSAIRNAARIENLEKRLDMIVVSVDKTSDSIKELSGQVRDLGNMVAIIATKTEADMQENDSDNQKHSTSQRTD